MKPNNLIAAALGLSLALGPLGIPTLAARPQAQEQQPSQEKKTETFQGQVIKAPNGQYALLMDQQSGKGLYLDDQEKAKQFEGKNVKVTGVLELAKGLIHVSEIEPA